MREEGSGEKRKKKETRKRKSCKKRFQKSLRMSGGPGGLMIFDGKGESVLELTRKGKGRMGKGRDGASSKHKSRNKGSEGRSVQMGVGTGGV
jgi:hypothetical protein